MSALCAYLDANLAGGRVCKGRIECPFHAWQFTGDGRAVSVPYSDTVPTRVAIESFPVQDSEKMMRRHPEPSPGVRRTFDHLIRLDHAAGRGHVWKAALERLEAGDTGRDAREVVREIADDFGVTL